MQKLTIQSPRKIERQINAYINNDPEGKFIFRLCSLKMLLHDPACTTESLGELMQTSPRSISNWVHKLNASGNIDVLRDKNKPGRSARLNKQQMEQLKEDIQKDPRDLGLDANLWDGKILSRHIQKQFGAIVQVRQCQRIFNQLGFRLKRGRTVVAKGDEKAKKAFKKTSEHPKKRKF